MWLAIVIILLIVLMCQGASKEESWRGPRGRRHPRFHRRRPYGALGPRWSGYPPWWHTNYYDVQATQDVPTADEVCVSVCQAQLGSCLADDETPSDKCYKVFGKCVAACSR